MAGAFSAPTNFSGAQQPAWNRTNVPQTAGSTPENPTARPDFYGQGFFNNMAFNQTPFSQQNPYGSFFQTPQYGGGFSPFGSTTGGAFNRGGNSSLYQPNYFGGFAYGGFPGGYNGSYGGGYGAGFGNAYPGPQTPPYAQPFSGQQAFSGYRRPQQRPWMGGGQGNPYGAGWA